MTAPSDGDAHKKYLANRAVPHMRKGPINCQATSDFPDPNCPWSPEAAVGTAGDGMQAALFLVVPQGRLVVLAAIEDANDIHGSARHLKQDRHAPTIPKRPQARPKVIAPCAPVRKSKLSQ